MRQLLENINKSLSRLRVALMISKDCLEKGQVSEAKTRVYFALQNFRKHWQKLDMKHQETYFTSFPSLKRVTPLIHVLFENELGKNREPLIVELIYIIPSSSRLNVLKNKILEDNKVSKINHHKKVLHPFFNENSKPRELTPTMKGDFGTQNDGPQKTSSLTANLKHSKTFVLHDVVAEQQHLSMEPIEDRTDHNVQLINKKNLQNSPPVLANEKHNEAIDAYLARIHFEQHIESLQHKISAFKGAYAKTCAKRYLQAIEVSERLVSELNAAKNDCYLSKSPFDEQLKSKFIMQCENSIQKAMPVLETHRGLKKICMMLLIALTFPVSVPLYYCGFFNRLLQTDSQERLNRFKHEFTEEQSNSRCV